MKQIDQEPGDYRVQRGDGSWTQRVNKPLCRWLGLIAIAAAGYFAIGSGGDAVVLYVGVMCFAAGGLITLSLKSIDW